MRIPNAVIVMVAVALLLAGCTSGNKHGSSTSPPANGTSNGTGVAAGDYCTRLVKANTTIAAAQTALYTGKASAATTLVQELKALQSGAPATIKTALAHMITAFQTAADLLKNPTSANQARLATTMQDLSKDSGTVAAYVASRCK